MSDQADLRELIAERAAIMEYDAGIPRAEAENLAVDSVAQWIEQNENERGLFNGR